MTGAERMAVGDAWEDRLADELRQIGWRVYPYGSASMPGLVREHLKQFTTSPLRWSPDLVAVYPGRSIDGVRFIDAKTSMHPYPPGHAHSHNVQTSSAWAAQGFAEWCDLPHWFVFDDGCCVTPRVVVARGRRGTPSPYGSGSGTPYLVVPDVICSRFTTVFMEES